jgi:hypothetical protein
MLLDIWSFDGISVSSSVKWCASEFDVVVLLCGSVRCCYVFRISVVVVGHMGMDPMHHEVQQWPLVHLELLSFWTLSIIQY